jgi:predicted transcriptional regulator
MEQSAKNRGRPKRVIDFAKVEKLAAIGCSQDEIAAELGIGETTLKRHCGPILKRGTKKCHVKLRSAMFRHAIKGDPRLLVFLGKVYLGLKEDPQTVVNVSQTAISVTDETKRRLSEMHALLRREALLEAQGNENGEHG